MRLYIYMCELYLPVISDIEIIYDYIYIHTLYTCVYPMFPYISLWDPCSKEVVSLKRAQPALFDVNPASARPTQRIRYGHDFGVPNSCPCLYLTYMSYGQYSWLITINRG